MRAERMSVEELREWREKYGVVLHNTVTRKMFVLALNRMPADEAPQPMEVMRSLYSYLDDAARVEKVV